jgi:hypothetical protein
MFLNGKPQLFVVGCFATCDPLMIFELFLDKQYFSKLYKPRLVSDNIADQIKKAILKK